MKINEVLEAYNKVIDTLREEKGIKAKGHFVAVTNIKKSMGPYKQFYVHILYCDVTKNINYPFAGAQLMERCPAGQEEEILNKCELAALKSFFLYCQQEGILDKVIHNTYERTK